MFQIFAVFPSLFFLSPFSATILRIAAAYAFFYIANYMIGEKHTIAHTQFPLVGQASEWMVWVSSILTAFVGVLLAIGLYTQAAAIAGVIISLKHAVLSRKYPAIATLSYGTCALLCFVCVSLLITGAGAVSLDLPL